MDALSRHPLIDQLRVSLKCPSLELIDLPTDDHFITVPVVDAAPLLSAPKVRERRLYLPHFTWKVFGTRYDYIVPAVVDNSIGNPQCDERAMILDLREKVIFTMCAQETALRRAGLIA